MTIGKNLVQADIFGDLLVVRTGQPHLAILDDNRPERFRAYPTKRGFNGARLQALGKRLATQAQRCPLPLAPEPGIRVAGRDKQGA